MTRLNYEDISVGLELPLLDKGTLTTAHLVRWSASIENWHKIHYDAPFAIEHDKLPALLINGSLKQNFIIQLLKDWVGRTGWVWKVNYQFRAMNKVGEALTVWGRVTGAERRDAYGLVELEIGIRNQDGVESTPGKATVALPYRDGPAVPYPFSPPQA